MTDPAAVLTSKTLRTIAMRLEYLAAFVGHPPEDDDHEAFLLHLADEYDKEKPLTDAAAVLAACELPNGSCLWCGETNISAGGEHKPLCPIPTLSQQTAWVEDIAEDAMWHDGLPNQEALDDIRKLLRYLGYTKEWARRRAALRDAKEKP